MAIEIDSDRSICYRCGTSYSRQKGYFPVSYAAMYKGVGHLPICKTCIDTMYTEYLIQSNDAEAAVRQMCRKLDLYWSKALFDRCIKKATTKTIMTNYIQATNNMTFAGKCYDDSLKAEGRMWRLGSSGEGSGQILHVMASGDGDVMIEDIPDEVLSYWGPGYSPEMYQDLEQRRTYWINNLPSDITPDVGMEALIRQICVLEIDINRISASGKSADKQIGMLDKLISSMNLKPGQKNDDPGYDKTPYGVWIDRLEHDRPVEDVDPELSDVDGISKKISTWFYGHASKMLGIKNMFCKLYEDKMREFSIERGESDDEDDDGYESLFNRIFGSSADG